MQLHVMQLQDHAENRLLIQNPEYKILNSQLLRSFFNIFIPLRCPGCGDVLPHDGSSLCLSCLLNLPYTDYASRPGNAVEKMFWGRVPIEAACSILHFTRHSPVQSILHHIKYHGDRASAINMGRLMGEILEKHAPYSLIDGIVPLPLYRKREKERGYNQSALLAEGISEVMSVPVIRGLLVRTGNTNTQTKKNRQQRWENVKNAFCMAGDPDLGIRRILLVDDVVTTGATLEAAASVLLRETGFRICISTLAYAHR
jgi:ComF family protein